jgi:tape measure domain-containing protein
MASKVEWALSLLDRTSAPAGKVEKSLSLLTQRLTALDKAAKEVSDPKIKDRLAFQRLGLETQRAQMQMRLAGEHTGNWIVRLHSALGVLGMIGNAVRGVAGGIANAAIGLGKFALASAADEEARMPALRRLFGGSDSGARAFKDQMDRLADRTPFGDDLMTGWGSSLLSSGFKTDEIAPILKAFTDAGAVGGFKPAAMDGVVSALRRINAEGRLTSRTMLAMVEAGVPAAKAYERIGKLFGTTAAGARELVKAGKVSANSGIYALVDTIRTSRSGGRLGSVGQEYAEGTVPGLQKRIQERWGRFFGDLFDGPGFKAYKGLLRNIGDALDSTSATGKRIGSAIDDVFNRVFSAVFGRFAGPDGAIRVETVIGKVLDGIDALTRGARQAWAFLEGVGSGLLTGFGPLKSIFGKGPLSEDRLMQVARAGFMVGSALGSFVDRLFSLLGVLKGFNDMLMGGRTGKTLMAGAERNQAGGFWNSIYNASPLQALEMVGSAFGDVLGADEATPAHGPIAQNWTGAGLPESMRMRPNVNANPTINLNFAGAPPANAAEIVNAAKQGVAEGMGAAMMSVAMSTGAQS